MLDHVTDRRALRDRESAERVPGLGQGRELVQVRLHLLRDRVREGIKKAVHDLQHLEITYQLMLTGDRRRAAEAIAREIKIPNVEAELLPEQKLERIRQLASQDRHVSMVGDGVNDAPALAAADIGLAMGSGTDIAMETAGVTLMRSDPRLAADAIDVSRATGRKIYQNLFWAFIYNVIGIPLAALGYLSPIIAGAAMAFSSVSVVSNALMLRRWKAKSSQK